MADNYTTNPPHISAIGDSPVTHGTILKYGLDTLDVTGVLIDSYSRSIKYASVDEIVGQNGIVEGVRMSDARAEISVSGRVKASGSYSGLVGAIFSINGDSSVITDISLSAGSKDFFKIDIKSTSYEGVTGLAPNS